MGKVGTGWGGGEVALLSEGGGGDGWTFDGSGDAEVVSMVAAHWSG